MIITATTDIQTRRVVYLYKAHTMLDMFDLDRILSLLPEENEFSFVKLSEYASDSAAVITEMLIYVTPTQLDNHREEMKKITLYLAMAADATLRCIQVNS